MSRVRSPWRESSANGQGRRLKLFFQRFVQGHLLAAEEVYEDLLIRWPVTLLVWLSMAVALSIPALLFLLQVNLQQALGAWHEGHVVSAFLQPGISEAQAAQATREIAAHNRVQSVELITPDTSLAQVGELVDADPQNWRLVDNPLPYSLRILLSIPNEEAGTAEEIENEVSDHFLSIPHVAEIHRDSEWAERLRALLQVFSFAMNLFAVLLIFAVVIVSIASVRLAMERRLLHLQVVHLLGGNRSALRRPYLYMGLIYGVGGSLLAAMLVAAVVLLFEQSLAPLAVSYGVSITIAGFDGGFLLTLFLVGSLAGLLGALLSVELRLRSLSF